MRFPIFVLAYSLAILGALPWRVAAVQSVNLSWDASSSPDIAGYRVHYRLDNSKTTATVPAGINTRAIVFGLLEGKTYCFSVTCLDSAGDESNPSNIAVYTVPGIAPPEDPVAASDPAPVLSWNPSPSPNVAGYHVYRGIASGSYTDRIYSGDATSLVLPDMEPGMTWYYVITAYGLDGLESGATTEISLTAPQLSGLAAMVAITPVLSLKQMPVTGLSSVYSLKASGPIPPAWAIEASSDLQTWAMLTTGSNSAVNVTVVASPKNQLLFRLASTQPGVKLRTQNPPGAFPNSFHISTAEALPAEWVIQFSENLQNWNPLTAGIDTPVNVAVVAADPASLYFRLKSL